MKPEGVRKAQIAGNKEALSRMGTAGAHAALEKKRLTAERTEAEALAVEIRQQEEMMVRAEEANEHIVPIDSDKD